MDIQLEDFSLLQIVPQFREFNSAVRDNRARLAPYFWWAGANDLTRFNFISSCLFAEKISRFAPDLPYNKKFIIRCDGKFSGVIGLDRVAFNAPRAEVWCFLTKETQGQHIASNVLKLVEDFAYKKHIGKIWARTARENRKSQYLLCCNDYNIYFSPERTPENCNQIMWYKILNDKNIEK